MRVRGFIVQPTYRIEAGRPVVHLFGRLETGEAFLARDARPVPCFFVRAADAEAARAAGATRLHPVDFRTMRGEPVVRVEVTVPADAPPLRDALRARGIQALEADVRFAMRYLIDRGLRGAVVIDGPERGAAPAPGSAAAGPLRRFENCDLVPGDWEPPPGALKILSLDLETDPRGEKIHAAAIHRAGREECLLALPEAEVVRRLAGSPVADRAMACGDESGLLRELARRMIEADFDILTGWNVINFDLAVLVAAAKRLGVPLEVGRVAGAVRVLRDDSYWGRARAEIPGRVVLDGIDLLKGAFIRLEDYRLETAAREFLGTGKVVLAQGDAEAGHGPGRGRGEAIERTFRDDLPRFVEYNLADARLVTEILAKTHLIELAVRRSLLTGMPLDRVGASIASFDSLYLGELRRRGFVAPSVGTPPAEIEPTAGGAVLDPVTGLHDYVLAFDFKSLYPSLIRTFNIDPLGYVPDPSPAEAERLIRAPNGAHFKREPGILPGMVATLFPRREAAKRAGDSVGSHAIKILMNSLYGVLATPACRFYSSPIANAITLFGQWALHWARERMESWGHRVLYGDTDSLFVAAAASGPPAAREEALRLGEALCARVNDAIRDHIRERWKVTSHLELEFETLYLKLFLPAMRHAAAGARKRYAGLVHLPGVSADSEGRDEIVFVGMEAVRRDWTELAKIFQRGLFERLFRGAEPALVADYLREFVSDLRAGRHDGELVYRKALRKGVEEYTATTPPHVKAARKMGPGAGGVIEYVMTKAGPEPLTARTGPIDYPHYVDKQLRPIADQVLPLLRISFDEALGEEAQRNLF